MRGLAMLALLAPALAAAAGLLDEKAWIHGSPDCATNTDPPIEVRQHDGDTYVLRQNKCVHFEAPFIYVLFGERAVLVLDTGATADPQRFPLYDTVQGLMAARGAATMDMVVAHSHSHADHKAADAQFTGKPGVTLVAPTGEAVRRHFGLSAWPQGTATVDLGNRTLTVIPAPGHQDEAIAIYDTRTQWLLTGDSLYPGRLYVKHWDEYRASIRRLAQFAGAQPVAAVMGTHVELSKSGKQFRAGSTYQPDEAPLPLAAADLAELDRLLHAAGDDAQEIVTPRFVVAPLTRFQRWLGKMLSWFGD
jgi:hydroxyacylglutathione hydrolase